MHFSDTHFRHVTDNDFLPRIIDVTPVSGYGLVLSMEHTNRRGDTSTITATMPFGVAREMAQYILDNTPQES